MAASPNTAEMTVAPMTATSTAGTFLVRRGSTSRRTSTALQEEGPAVGLVEVGEELSDLVDVRTLGRSPGFTITALVVAAVGIGATTAGFTMLDHVMLRPRPFRDADRLVKIYEDEKVGGARRVELSPSNFRDWKAMATGFEALEAFTMTSLNLIGAGDPERLSGASVTGGMLSMLGATPALGRLITTADDDELEAPPTIILSHRVWTSLFSATPSILGRKIILDGQPFTVIGVMPARFYFPNRETEFWTPFRFDANAYSDRTNTYIYGVGRLKNGVSLEQARAQLQLVAAQLERANPKEIAGIGATVIPWRDLHRVAHDAARRLRRAHRPARS